MLVVLPPFAFPCSRSLLKGHAPRSQPKTACGQQGLVYHFSYLEKSCANDVTNPKPAFCHLRTVTCLFSPLQGEQHREVYVGEALGFSAPSTTAFCLEAGEPQQRSEPVSGQRSPICSVPPAAGTASDSLLAHENRPRRRMVTNRGSSYPTLPFPAHPTCRLLLQPLLVGTSVGFLQHSTQSRSTNQHPV